MSLALVHGSPRVGCHVPGVATWATCLREVRFLDADTAERVAGDLTEVLRGEHAYALLLEIVCGLRSPLAGETEVQAQFKGFLATLDATAHADLLRLGRRVLADAKQIRSTHLQGFGAEAYGPLVSTHVTTPHVTLIGTGALARQVARRLPETTALDVWHRHADSSLRRVRPDATHRPIDSAALIPWPETYGSSTKTTIVVAAPIGDADLHAVLAGCRCRVVLVLDLRAADQRTPLQGSTPVRTLDDLLATTDSSSAGNLRPLARARADVRRLARAFALSEVLHPFGWDDLCA